MSTDTSGVPITDLFPHLGEEGPRASKSGVGSSRPVARTGDSPLDEWLAEEPPEPEGTTFYESDFWEEYLRRRRAEQDMVVLVSDYENDRGTGKTTLSLRLCEEMDHTDDGFTASKASLSPQELLGSYTNEPRGSALLLDEAEAGMNRRDAMSKVNKLFSKMMSMARVERKYLVLNMPAANHIDRNILDLAHFWILVKRKGLARVYSIENNPFRGQSYPKAVCKISWDAVPHSHPVYRQLSQEKQDALDDPTNAGDAGYFTQEEHEEILRRRLREALKTQRDVFINRLTNHPAYADLARGTGPNQSDLGDVFEVKQSHVSTQKHNPPETGASDDLGPTTGPLEPDS
jgi:hypothetical protein